MSLRLMVFDRTCTGGRVAPGLSRAWWLGAHLYRRLGRFDACLGVGSWREALDWLGGVRAGDTVSEIQFWGHGKWGSALIDDDVLDAGALEPSHHHRDRLARIRDRMEPDGAWWFRTCETFGAEVGHELALRWTEFFERRAAGHTYVIGFWQSGLHSLSPGEQPGWSADEGLAEGSPSAPVRAHDSRLRAPNTITCLRGAVPAGW
jgi:hypothetical protein